MPELPSSWSAEGDINTSDERGRWLQSQLTESTRARLAEDSGVFLHQSLSSPCLNALAGAQGAGFTDVEGRHYLDFHGNNVHQVGFAHPRVIAAVKAQLDELSFCPRRYVNDVSTRFAQTLLACAPPSLTRLLLAPAGTIAVSMALKLARLATGRFKTISTWDAFHGATLDAISVGGETQFRRGVGPLLPGTEHAPPCEVRGCPFRCGTACSLACADYIEYMLEREGDVAAVIGETVRCTPAIPPPDYWRRIRAACDRHGALLILDEIPLGLGRTGRFFAFEHFGVVPDMVVLGKGLGGAVMPLAALLAREELNVVGPSSIGHFTHEKSPVACAAGLATLEVIRDERLVEHAAALGARALADLRRLAERHPLVGDVRGLGLVLGVELLRDHDPAQPAREEANRVLYACLRRGLSFKLTRGNMLTLTPALVLTVEEWEKALRILDEALTEVEAG